MNEIWTNSREVIFISAKEREDSAKTSERFSVKIKVTDL